MQSTRYSCKILKTLEISRDIFEKYSNIKFHQTPSSRSPVVLSGRTDRQRDRHDEANSRFSKFCERAPKKLKGNTRILIVSSHGTTDPSGTRTSPLSKLHYHTQTHHSRQDSSGRVISQTQRPLPAQHTTPTRDREPIPRRDSNPQSQQCSSRRSTSQTARPMGSAEI